MKNNRQAVELLVAVLKKFENDFHISPKTFLFDLIQHFGSAAHKRESEGFNYEVCVEVFKEMYSARDSVNAKHIDQLGLDLDA